MELLILFLLGNAIGFLSSFFGIGGGLVAVPALYFLFPNISAPLVIGTSLFMAFLNASRNVRLFLKKGYKVDLKFIVPIAVFTLFASFTTKYWVDGLSTDQLKKIFAVFLWFVIVKLVFLKDPKTKDNEDWMKNVRLWKSVILGAIMGSASVLLGIGGGMITIPTFIILFSMPTNWISFYSNTAVIFSSLFGAFAFLISKPLIVDALPYMEWTVGSVHILMALLMFLGGSFSYKWGVNLQDKISEKVKKRSFAVFLLFVSVKMWFG